ncbi:MAG TPA: M48 family metallopeptidase [Terracidiphilus sp.]|nr:M48 family metallopeptidase [Terracidiphilus sp.]
MTFIPRTLWTLCLAVLLASLTPRLSSGQPAPAQPAPAQPAPASTAAPVSTAPPAQPASTQAYNLPPDKLAKAKALSRISLTLEIVGSLWGLAFLWLLLSLRWAAGIAAWTERLLRRRWMQGLLFFAVYLVIGTLANLPLDMIGHAVSRHYGISVQGWPGWFGDLAKGMGLTLLFGTPVLLFFNWIVRVSPRRYWIWIWLVSLPLIVLSIFASPLLDPIFNKFEPLEKNHSALVARLEQVVARTGTNIPPERMYLMKASEKSNGLNAYVTGIGATKRFVMWDTATDRLPDDEVLFVFGHESGHYVLNHIPKQLGGTTAGLFFILWACAWFAGWLARRYGARWQLVSPEGSTPLASRQGFLVLLFALSVAGIILQPASSTFSRHFEHEADVYGQEAIHGLVADPQKTAVSAFNHLGEAWLEDPNPSAFVEFWTYNHPSVQNRANFALHYDPWVNGGHGKFFEK